MEERKESAELKGLLEHQKQIKGWLSDVKKRIYETETMYLEETQLGNVVKGWEVDGRPPLARVRGQCDEKERLFSYSSYETWVEHKQIQDGGEKKAVTHSNTTKLIPGVKGRKNKKRKSDAVEDWNQGGDY